MSDQKLINADILKGAFEMDGYKSPYVERLIDACPTVDAVPLLHARWIDCYPDNEVIKKTVFECSKCHESVFVNFTAYARFCPACGAKMDGGVKDAAD